MFDSVAATGAGDGCTAGQTAPSKSITLLGHETAKTAAAGGEEEADDKNGSNGKHTKVVYLMYMGALPVSGRHARWEFELVTWV